MYKQIFSSEALNLGNPPFSNTNLKSTTRGQLLPRKCQRWGRRGLARSCLGVNSWLRRGELLHEQKDTDFPQGVPGLSNPQYEFGGSE